MGLITICGPVGCGKTTLVRSLAERRGLRALVEGDDTDNPFLARAYADPSWQAASQRWFAAEALGQATLTAGEGKWLWERPADERLAIFSEAAHERGEISTTTIRQLRRTADRAMRFAPRPALRIAIMTDADTLDCQINGRDRSCERVIDRAWIESHLARYEDFYAAQTDTPTLWLDPAEVDWRTEEGLSPITDAVSDALAAPSLPRRLLSVIGR